MRKTAAVTKGRLTGYGPNKTEARADLSKQIDRWCSVEDPHMEVRFGYVLIAFNLPYYDNVAYRVIDPAEAIGPSKVLHASCTMNGPLQRAIDDGRFSIAQRCWNRENDETLDEVHLVRSGLTGEKLGDLRSWIRWQRSFDRAVAAGKSEAEARDLASGLR